MENPFHAKISVLASWAPSIIHPIASGGLVKGIDPEGTTRVWFDRQRFIKSVAELEKKPLSGEDRARLRSEADRQVREGRLESSQVQEWLGQREADELVIMHERGRRVAAEKADQLLGVPGELPTSQVAQPRASATQIKVLDAGVLCNISRRWAGVKVVPCQGSLVCDLSGRVRTPFVCSVCKQQWGAAR
jgi:hypothetical protein